MRNVLVFGSLALVAMVWTGVGAQQEMRPRPGPGSGVTPISGSVGVTSLPPVDAKQSGEWRVAVTDLPEVRVAGPSFVEKGRRYKITWTNGDEQTVTVSSPGADGWVQVVQDAAWLNLRNARSVEALN
jgi:hypothetical protein